jgi:hypothetical protein
MWSSQKRYSLGSGDCLTPLKVFMVYPSRVVSRFSFQATSLPTSSHLRSPPSLMYGAHQGQPMILRDVRHGFMFRALSVVMRDATLLVETMIIGMYPYTCNVMPLRSFLTVRQKHMRCYPNGALIAFEQH